MQQPARLRDGQGADHVTASAHADHERPAGAGEQGVGVGHQCSVPGAPLNGPWMSPVIQPP